MCRTRLILVFVLVLAACGSDQEDVAVVDNPTTTSAPTTSAPATTTPTTSRAASTSTVPATTVVAANEQVVDSGTSPAGSWQLVAFKEPRNVVCAGVRVDRREADPRACSGPSEQDFNGNDTLRYAAGESFLVGVTSSTVAKVQMHLRDGTMVERATVAATFTSTFRFAALYLPPGAVIRSLSAVDGGGRRLTSITINP